MSEATSYITQVEDSSRSPENINTPPWLSFILSIAGGIATSIIIDIAKYNIANYQDDST